MLFIPMKVNLSERSVICRYSINIVLFLLSQFQSETTWLVSAILEMPGLSDSTAEALPTTILPLPTA